MNAPYPISPALDDLVDEIDQQINRCPHSSATEKISSFFADRLDLFKRTGQQYLRFFLNNMHFALPLVNAIQIGYTPGVTPLPNVPHWVLGICNIRGEIISVVDLKTILKIEKQTAGKSPHLIIIRNNEMATGVLVDKIAGILFEGDPNRRLQKKELKDGEFSFCVQHILVSDQQNIHLLDAEKLFSLIQIDKLERFERPAQSITPEASRDLIV